MCDTFSPGELQLTPPASGPLAFLVVGADGSSESLRAVVQSFPWADGFFVAAGIWLQGCRVYVDEFVERGKGSQRLAAATAQSPDGSSGVVCGYDYLQGGPSLPRAWCLPVYT